MLNGEICKIKKVFLMLLSSCIHKNSTSNIEMTSDEWRKIINLARVHNVLPLVFEEASENESFISLPEYQQVAFETMSIVAGQARRTEEFLNLYSKLLKAGLYPIVMKGLVCRQLYGEYCDHRPSGDEDILIEKNDFWQAQEIFIEEGFIPQKNDINSAQLEEVQEVSFLHKASGLLIELHINTMERSDPWYASMSNCFNEVFLRKQQIELSGIKIWTMSHTDHVLFLILHALKHLVGSGLGIRQVLDILLYVQKYGKECNWEYLDEMLQRMNAKMLFSDIIFLGNVYLGFSLELLNQPVCLERLLGEILGGGIFGVREISYQTAGNLTRRAIAENINNKGKCFYVVNRWFRTLFPKVDYLKLSYTELYEKPYLLPICWVKRWGRFLAHNKASGGSLVAESMKISKRRIELLKKYDIL